MAEVLQVLSADKYDQLQQILQQDLPRSSVVVNWFRTQLDWLRKMPGFTLRILCPDGDCRKGTFVGLAKGGDLGAKEVVVVYAAKEHTSDLRNVLLRTQLVDWRHIVHVLGVLEDHLPVIEEVLASHALSQRLSHVSLYCMDPHTAASLHVPQHDADVTTRSLSVRDEDVVCDNWMHYSPEKRPVVTAMLRHNLSVGVEVSGALAVTLLESHYGGLGLLHTLPQHQGKGLATLAVSELTRILGQQGHTPVILVTHGSAGAARIATKLGYTQLCNAAFVYVE